MTSRFSALSVLFCVAFAGTTSTAAAQGANPLSANARVQFTGISAFVTRSADKIPENLYSFRATPDVRSIAQLFGHIADAYFGMCSLAGGGKPPQQSYEKTATTKAALAKALADGVSYCQSVMAGMTDQKGSAETVDYVFGPTPKLGLLFFVTTHTYEHYGNLVTYMRLNKIVPPSSEAPPAAPPGH
jgi:uncharacterized damage-inducible protein DinB